MSRHSELRTKSLEKISVIRDKLREKILGKVVYIVVINLINMRCL